MNIGRIKVISLTMFGALTIYSCANTKNTNNFQRFEVKVQEKTFSLEVLNVTTFRNGEPIPEAKTEEEWIKAGREGRPAWCCFNNNANSGIVYNWFAVNSLKGLAPSGWHVPTDAEWTNIVNQFGGDWEAGKNLTEATEDRIQCSGIRDSLGNFVSHVGGWWSKTNMDEKNALRRFGYPGKDFLLRSYNSKMEGLSVICVQD